MPFTHITPPVVGDPTRLDTFGAPVVSDLEYLYAQQLAQSVVGIPNGSFESGTLPNTAPGGWALSIAAGNSTAFETSAPNTDHGAQAFSMTTPGSIAGGVVLTSADYMPCSPAVRFNLSWEFMSSSATSSVSVQIQWYNTALGVISTSTLYSASSGLATTWTNFGGTATSPALARFFKIIITGVNNNTAATNYWDGFSIFQCLPRPITGHVTGSGNHTTGIYTTRLKVTMKGGGGSGASGWNGASSTAGNAGTATTFNGVSARGGNGGGSATASLEGVGGAVQAAAVSATLLQEGSGPGQDSVAGVGGPQSGNGGGLGGHGGPTGGGISGGGGGAEGEQAVYFVDCTAGQVFAWSIGGGGAAVGTSTFVSKAGAAGWMLIEEIA